MVERVLVACLLAAIAGCDRASSTSAADTGIGRTQFPGEVTAGGGTSGAAMEQAGKPGQGNASQGTPGIPQGAEGNVSGANMGGTTPQSAPGTQSNERVQDRTPAPTAKAEDDAAKKAKADADAAREKQQLADSMDAVAARWKTRAAKEGYGRVGAQPDRLSPEAKGEPPRSEKAGTAEPSRDVKQPKPESR